MTASDSAIRPSPVGGWREPVALCVDTAEPFPLGSLPPAIRNYVELLVREINGAHVNLVAPAALGVLSGAQGAAWIHVKHKWKEAGPLWVATVAGSGAAKSPVLNALAESVGLAEQLAIQRDAETRAHRQADYDAACEDADLAVAKLKTARREPLPTDPAELKKHQQKLIDLRDASAEAAKARASAARQLGEVPKVLVHGADATSQAMHDLLARYPHLLILVDEGTDLFRTIADKNQAQSQIWIKAHGMAKHERHIVSREVAENAHGSLCMVLVIQPAIIMEHSGNSDITDVGFLPRFLLADARGARKRMEDEDDFFHLGHAKLLGGAQATPEDAAWSALIHTEVARTWRNRGEPTRWTFTRDAAKLFAANINNYIVVANSDPDQESHVHSALDKVRGMAVRIARIIAQSKLPGPATPSFSFPFSMSGTPVYTDPTVSSIYDADGTISCERILEIDAESVQAGWDIALWQYRQYRHLFHSSDTDARRDLLVLSTLRGIAAFIASTDGEDYVTIRGLLRGALRFVKASEAVPSPSREVEKVLDFCTETGWLVSQKVGKSTRYYPHPELPEWLAKLGMI